MNPQLLYRPVKVSMPEAVLKFVQDYCKFTGTDLDEFWTGEINGAVKSLLD